MSEVIAAWTPVIIKGAVYTPEISFDDEDGVAIAVSSATVYVTPNGSAAIEWSQGNGLFLNTATGVYQLALDEAYTAALTWESGRYRIQVTEPNGDVNPCIIEGLIFAKECVPS